MAVLNKFDAGKTMYFRGFSGIDSPASLHSVSGTPLTGQSFTVSGIYRDPAAFWVLVIYDADDFYGHPRIKPLPDFNLTGMVLEFDVTFSGAVGYDCPKYPTIDWPFLDYILEDGSVGSVDLSVGNIQYTNRTPNATQNTNPTTVTGGSHVAASVTLAVDVGGSAAGDVLALWFQNFAYSYRMLGGDNPNYVAAQLAAGINAYSYAGEIYGLSATSSGANVTITACFPGTAGATKTAQPGVDGNLLQVYWTSPNVSRVKFTTGTPGSPINLAGGTSGCTYHVKLDFSALGLASVRQLVMTFAPLLANGAAYINEGAANYGTQADISFTNWKVTADPDGHLPLQVAAPGSVRVEETDAWTTAVGTWNPTNVGWFSQGFAIYSNTPGDTITVNYTCQFEHDLWLGTSVYSDRGKFGVTIDGAAVADLDMMTVEYSTGSTVGMPSTGGAISEAISTRRRLVSSVSAGAHTVVLTVKAGDAPPAGITSYGYCYFDFLEAVVSGDVPAAPGPWTDRAPAFDYDTQHGYQLAPARLLWMMDALGFTGPMNLYVGAFWWNQRDNPAQVLPSITIDFTALPALTAGTAALFVDLAGTTIGKSVFANESAAIWASHFACFINGTFSGVWASASAGVLTITVRSAQPAYAITPITAYYNNGGSNVAITPSPSSTGLAYEADNLGTWMIDPAQTPVINYAAQCWMADLFAGVQSRGNICAASFSMELVYPPDQNTVGNVWAQRFKDGTVVITGTGFENINSTQCSPMAASFLAYQKAVYLQTAGLQSAAGLTPYLQFGEFLWWFFSQVTVLPIGYIAILSAVRIDTSPTPHGWSVGEVVHIAGVEGLTSINGAWAVTAVPDPYHFEIGAPAIGTWVAGTGTVTVYSMAYYDAETSAAAETALGRALAQFQQPTDDPSVNSYADANFLAGRLNSHVAAIAAYLQGTYSAAVLEILWPGDVNGTNVTPLTVVGGRLNNYVNLPSQWKSHTTAPFQIFKLEQLAFMTTDRNMDLVKAGLAYAVALDWPLSSFRYLYPVDNQGVAQWREYRAAQAAGFTLFTPFAMDQICLIGWAVEPPAVDVTAQTM